VCALISRVTRDCLSVTHNARMLPAAEVREKIPGDLLTLILSEYPPRDAPLCRGDCMACHEANAACPQHETAPADCVEGLQYLLVCEACRVTSFHSGGVVGFGIVLCCRTLVSSRS
jgi:hypothetical protein